MRSHAEPPVTPPAVRPPAARGHRSRSWTAPPHGRSRFSRRGRRANLAKGRWFRWPRRPTRSRRTAISPGTGCSPLCFLVGLPRSNGGTATEVRTDPAGSAESDERHKASTAPDGGRRRWTCREPELREEPVRKGYGRRSDRGFGRYTWGRMRRKAPSLATRRATPQVRARLFGRVLLGSRSE